jgi:hypothetical protein
MSFTSEQRAVIKEIVADFLRPLNLMNEKTCTLKMDNQEDDMQRFEKRINSLSNKSWAIILMLLSLLATQVAKVLV